MIPTPSHHPLPRDGTSQSGRDLPDLPPDRHLLDDRSLADLLVQLSRSAGELTYWGLQNQVLGSWAPFFDRYPAVQLAGVGSLSATDLAAGLSARVNDLDPADEASFLPTARELFDLLSSWAGRFDSWGKMFAGTAGFAEAPDRAIASHLRAPLAETVSWIQPVLGADAADWLNPLENLLTRASWDPDPRAEPPAPGVAGLSRPDQLAGLKERLTALSEAIVQAVAFVADRASRAIDSGALETGSQPAHLGLVLACLRVFRHAQAAANDLVRRHLEFYYRAILQLRPRPARMDRVHAVFEPARGVDAVRLPGGTRVFAGKDDAKVDLHFGLVRELVVNQGRIAELRSLHVDSRAHGQWRHAAVARSADGLGRELPKDAPTWAAFGHPELPAGRRGFAIAAPVLRMTGGQKTITTELFLSVEAGAALEERCVSAVERGAPAASGGAFALTGLFTAAVTGPDGWITLESVTARFQPGLRKLSIVAGPLPPDTSVVAHDPEVHARGFETRWPVLEITLAPASETYPGSMLDDLAVESVTVRCAVVDDLHLLVANDLGALDPAKPFQPLGPVPTVTAGGSDGSSFYVGSAEILSKRLESLALNIEWKDLPADLAEYFHDYYSFTPRIRGSRISKESLVAIERSATTPTFKVRASYLRDTEWHPLGANETLHLFESPLALNAAELSAIGPDPDLPEFSGLDLGLSRGFLKFTLVSPDFAFGHADYGRLYTEAVILAVKSSDPDTVPNLPNPPFSPWISRISADYTAVESATFGQAATLEFFHVEPHGEWRADAAAVPALVPSANFDGALLIGVGDFTGGRQLGLLFHLADGSGNPFVAYPEVEWQYLAGNEWRAFESVEVVADATNELRRTGIILFSVPEAATTRHGRMPAGLVWLRAVARGDTTAINRFVDVYAQAVEAEFIDQGNNLSRLATPLPAGSVSRLVTGQPEIKKALQPLPSFGGRTGETAGAFRRRVSERLRHRNRAIALWDYERLVLQEFPELHRVKCVPHSTPESSLAPGCVMVVVVPRLSADAYDPLRPAVSQDLRDAIEEFLLPRMSGLVQNPTRNGRRSLHVVNPSYEEVQVVAKVVLRAGYDRGFHERQIQEDLTRFLAPWAFDGEAALTFESRLFPSTVLNFIEEREYVDYLTDFRVRQWVNGTPISPDPTVLKPTRPQSLLVPARRHELTIA